jgi:hypothetical protein
MSTSLSYVTLLLEQEETSSANDSIGEIGDTFKYKVTVDLPHITTPTNIIMEIFALNHQNNSKNSEMGFGGFTFCSTAQVVGSNIIAGDPTISKTMKNENENENDSPNSSVVSAFYL